MPSIYSVDVQSNVQIVILVPEAYECKGVKLDGESCEVRLCRQTPDIRLWPSDFDVSCGINQKFYKEI